MFRNNYVLLALCATLVGCSGGRGTSASTSTPAPPSKSPAAEHAEGDGHDHAKEEAGHDPGGGEEHDKEGELKLKPEQLRLIGVATQSVATREVQAMLSLPGTIVGDPDLQTNVSARVAGILEGMNVKVGDRVRRGQALATLSSPEVARLKVEYQAQVVEQRLASSNLSRRVSLARLGDVTRRPLEEAQKEVAQSRTDIDTSAAQLELARKKLERLEILLRDGIASRQQVDEARATLREAQARNRQAYTDLQVAQRHLSRENQIQRSGVQIDSEAFQAQAEIQRSGQAAESLREALLAFGTEPDAPGGSIVVVSPIDGIVTERPKRLGEQVQPGDLLASVLNPARVWAWMDLPQEAVGSVAPQSEAEVKVAAFPDRTFSGRVTFISPTADPDTKKIRARVELSNQDSRLRPNMLAQVRVGAGAGRSVLAVPREAVVQMENKPVVYVQEDPGTFHRRTIELGEKTRDWVEVRSGLKAGETIATKGVPALRSEDQRASSGEEGHSH